MASKPRPSLTSLGPMLATKPSPAPAPEAAPTPPSLGRPARETDGRVQVLVRMTPAERKALRRIALDQDTTVQSLVEDLLRDLIGRHGG